MKPRKRKCKHCGEWFMPFNSFQTWCSPDCGLALSKTKLESQKKKEAAKKRKEEKERRKAERAELKKRKQELKPLSWFHKKAAKACNEYIRYRDRNDICISCDKPLAFEEKFDAGHFKTQGAHKWIAYDEKNINGQCVECNQWKSGNEAAQRPRLVAKWGEAEVERLEQSGKNLGEKSYTRDELLEIEAHYKKKLKELKESD